MREIENSVAWKYCAKNPKKSRYCMCLLCDAFSQKKEKKVNEKKNHTEE